LRTRAASEADVGGKTNKNDPSESRKARSGAWPNIHAFFSEMEIKEAPRKMEEEKDEEKDSKIISSLDALYFNGTVRAGQLVEHEGTVVINGDVNNDGSVVAGGDVIVLGKLRGEAIAGRNGDEEAEILALQMEPAQLRIADVYAYGPKGLPGAEIPEKAVLIPDSSGVPRMRIVQAYKWSKTANVTAPSSLFEKKEKLRKSSPTINTAFMTGTYISIVGIALMLFPTTVFGLLFDVRYISTGWIRVFGVLSVVFGIYYWGSAYGDTNGTNSRAFYVSTIVGRMFLFFAFAMLVATKRFAEPALLVLGMVNLFGAMAMYNALRSAAPGASSA